MRPRIFLVLLLPVLVGMLRAQAPLNLPVPLEATTTAPSSGENALAASAADRALEMGFPSVAAGLYRNLLARPGTDRGRIVLGLATALLDDGRPAEAEKALRDFVGLHDAAWRLRLSLAEAQQVKISNSRTDFVAIRPEQISPADRAWYFYLQGLLADAANDNNRARDFYQQAEDSAGSSFARARFMLAREEARLRLGAVKETDLEITRGNFERFQGRKISYGIARTYAAMLDALGRRNEAIALLQRQLVTIPLEEREELDTTRLVLGLIAGATEGPGRSALGELLRDGTNRDKQRIALQLLARASTREPARTDFRRRLDALIGAPSPHPILEDLLLFRAVQALADKNYAQAEDDARALLQRFPGSPLRAHALGVLTASAWERERYRTAADNAVKARAELPPGPAHAQLEVLVAEAWFRAGDFRSAADAYAATLREPPAGVPTGDLMFQRVLAEIEAGSLDTAQTVLDELAMNPAFDAVNRWQAEWNLARALQTHDQTKEAYDRVNRLLQTSHPAPGQMPAELRARMAWLQARLSLEWAQQQKIAAAKTELAEQTLKLVDALPASLEGVTPELKNEVESTGALLKGEASFTLGKNDQALALLAELRKKFPESDAAIYSYFDEANYHVKRDETVDAQQLLTQLADKYPNNVYAPYALYQAALQAERRGQDANLAEANKLIEDLVKKYPRSDLVFYARLKQGDLLRKLNQFQQAQQAYDTLVNNYSQHRDVILAQLALAETHDAEAAGDPAHAEKAIVLFEHLRDRIDAPVDVRVEAGFNLGYLYSRQAAADRDKGDTASDQLNTSRAHDVWWNDVVNEFLLKDPKLAGQQLGARGRYWMARTLIEVGALFEQQEKLEEAKNAWLLILKEGLPGADQARARLARFSLPEAKP